MRGEGGAAGMSRFVLRSSFFPLQMMRVLHSDVVYLLGHPQCITALHRATSCLCLRKCRRKISEIKSNSSFSVFQFLGWNSCVWPHAVQRGDGAGCCGLVGFLPCSTRALPSPAGTATYFLVMDLLLKTEILQLLECVPFPMDAGFRVSHQARHLSL